MPFCTVYCLLFFIFVETKLNFSCANEQEVLDQEVIRFYESQAGKNYPVCMRSMLAGIQVWLLKYELTLLTRIL